jgi:hypothetical protein
VVLFAWLFGAWPVHPNVSNAEVMAGMLGGVRPLVRR